MRRCWLALALCWTLVIPPTDIVRVIDGDTFLVRVEIPAHPSTGEPERRIIVVRVVGVDTPEMKAPTREPALAAKLFTTNWLYAADTTIKALDACKLDFNGRQLGIVTRGDQNLATELIRANHGRPR